MAEKTHTIDGVFAYSGVQSKWHYNFSASFSSNVNSPANVKVDDNAEAEFQNASYMRMYSYSQAIRGDSVLGIQVQVHARADTAGSGNYFNVDLSWDGGTSWTTAKTIPASDGLTTTEFITTAGGNLDTWGRSWTVAEINNTSNFVVRITYVAGTGTYAYVDYIAWRVFTSFSSSGTWDMQQLILVGTDDGTEEQINDSPTWYSQYVNGLAGYYNDGGTIYEYYLGLAFRSIGIPQGAQIISAKITLAAYGTQNNAVELKIWGIDADDFGDFGSSPNLPSEYEASATTAQIDWDLTTSDSWTDKAYYLTPEIKTIIQEIVDRGGWVSGSGIGIVVMNDEGENVRGFSAFERTGFSPYLLLDWLTYTTHTADAIILVASTYTVDAIIKIIDVSSHTIDAIVTTGIYKSHTVDGIIQETLIQTNTADAVVKVAGTTTNTADGIVKETFVKSYTADGIVRITTSIARTSDGIVKIIVVATHTADGSIRDTLVKTNTADGIIFVTQLGSITSDGIVRETFIQVNTADAIIQVAGQATPTADGIVRVTTLVSYTTDGVIVVTADFEADLWSILLTETAIHSITADGIVKEILIQVNTADGVVKEALIEAYTVDGIVLETRDFTYTVDGILQQLGLFSTTADGIVRETLIFTNTVDGVVFETRVASPTADGIVRERFIQTNTVDGVIRVAGQVALTVDGIIFETRVILVTADGIVRDTYLFTSTSDGIIKEIFVETITADGVIRATQFFTITVGASVQDTFVETNTADAIIKQRVAQTITADGIVREILIHAYTADAIVQVKGVKTPTADAIILVTTLQSYTADAVIVSRVAATHTADGVVKERFVEIHTADAYIAPDNFPNSPFYLYIGEDLSIRLGNSRISTWTTAGRPAGIEGVFGYNLTTDRLEIYDGSAWQEISGTGGGTSVDTQRYAFMLGR